MWLARNEDHGLRCIYHGWKFDVTGRCVDMPTEPAQYRFAHRIGVTSYPIREVAGVAFAYLGPKDKQPPFPDFQWLKLPPKQSVPFKVLEECNYAQALEGGVDFAHAPVLHRAGPWSNRSADVREQNLVPGVEVQDTDYGFLHAGLWPSNGRVHVRIHPFIFPCWTVVAPNAFGSANGRGDRVVNAWVPRDDYTTWHFQYFYNPDRAVDREWRVQAAGYYVDSSYRKLRNIDNRFQQSREAMRTASVSGIDGVLTQDHAVNESQGRVVDRSQEHLGTTDLGIIHLRKMLLHTAKVVSDGQEPPGLTAALDNVTSHTLDLPPDVSWQEMKR